MPPVRHWFFCSLGAFACGLALAQTAATPAAAREEGNGKQAQNKAVTAVAPAPAAVEPQGEAALARAAEPPSRAGNVATIPQATEPTVETAAALVSKPAVAPLPNATAAAPEPAAQGPAAPEPVRQVVTAAMAEPTPLTLLRRVEPAIPPS